MDILKKITKNFTYNKLIRNYDTVCNFVKAHLSAKEKIRDVSIIFNNIIN